MERREDQRPGDKRNTILRNSQAIDYRGNSGCFDLKSFDPWEMDPNFMILSILGSLFDFSFYKKDIKVLDMLVLSIWTEISIIEKQVTGICITAGGDSQFWVLVKVIDLGSRAHTFSSVYKGRYRLERDIFSLMQNIFQSISRRQSKKSKILSLWLKQLVVFALSTLSESY